MKYSTAEISNILYFETCHTVQFQALFFNKWEAQVSLVVSRLKSTQVLSAAFQGLADYKVCLGSKLGINDIHHGVSYKELICILKEREESMQYSSNANSYYVQYLITKRAGALKVHCEVKYTKSSAHTSHICLKRKWWATTLMHKIGCKQSPTVAT